MNIFVLDHDIELCARYHCDQHVARMIPRYARILQAALNLRGFDLQAVPACADHPCVLWAGASFDNFLWLKDLAFFLNDEYRLRFDRADDHRAIETLHSISRYRFERRGLTPFPQMMPDRYRVAHDPVRAYRRFYIGDMLSFARWRLRGMPGWIAESLPESA